MDLIQARSTLQQAAEEWSEAFLIGGDPSVGLIASVLVALTGYAYAPHNTVKEACTALMPMSNAAAELAFEGLNRVKTNSQVPS